MTGFDNEDFNIDALEEIARTIQSVFMESRPYYSLQFRPTYRTPNSDTSKIRCDFIFFPGDVEKLEENVPTSRKEQNLDKYLY
ncbi:1450_t:CDS:2 [Rhizophagus irregularis]|nr:1450_t:CDS:2 [Rhizophagus irregularis]